MPGLIGNPIAIEVFRKVSIVWIIASPSDQIYVSLRSTYCVAGVFKLEWGTDDKYAEYYPFIRGINGPAAENLLFFLKMITRIQSLRIMMRDL